MAMDLQLGLPKAKGLFITGTDTGVGKTLIAGGIARLLADDGIKVGVFKPVASGCRDEREGLVSSDAEFLSVCARSEEALSVISPITFSTPATPSVCEEIEKQKVDFEQIAGVYKYLCDKNDFMIVEGIGGVRVPISAGVDLLDLAMEFGLPVVIVTRPDLGTINHTLLTIDAVRAAGLDVAGLVINGYDFLDASIAEQTVADVLVEWGQTRVLSVVPRDDESDVEGGLLGESIIAGLSECDWVQLGT